MSGPTSRTHSFLTVQNGPGEEEKDMFTTDSFLGAEIAYRQEKIRRDYGLVQRWTRPSRTTTQK
jgi:hypothetical protein